MSMQTIWIGLAALVGVGGCADEPAMEAWSIELTYAGDTCGRSAGVLLYAPHVGDDGEATPVSDATGDELRVVHAGPTSYALTLVDVDTLANETLTASFVIERTPGPVEAVDVLAGTGTLAIPGVCSGSFSLTGTVYPDDRFCPDKPCNSTWNWFRN